MAAFIVIVIILLALGVLGVVVKGLLWLAIIAAVLVLIAAIYGWLKFRGSTNPST